MVKSRGLAVLLGLLLTTVSSYCVGWGECELKITVPEDANLQCYEDASETYDIEAEIISSAEPDEEINCTWTDRYDGLVVLERVDNTCRARLTAKKAEAYFLTVSYIESGKSKRCSTTKKFDVKPLCCITL